MGRGTAGEAHLAFQPSGQADLAPSGSAAKLKANLAALEVLDDLRGGRSEASASQQALLARWSGWGAIPQIFDESRSDFEEARLRARRILATEAAWDAARRTTLNAHYTSAAVIRATWQMLESMGFDAGKVLEPGCGSGNFVGFAPIGAEMVGVELDPTTAEIARRLYGARAEIQTGRFEDFGPSEASFDAAIGNVPFAKLTPHDPRHNRHKLALHNYCIVKSLHLVAPGGLVALLTSRYTLDARNPTARRVIHELADLAGAVRLPAGTFSASSGTDVVTDLLVLRRRELGQQPADDDWLRVVPVGPPGSEPVHLNAWFEENPSFVLGEVHVGRGMYRNAELTVRADGDVETQLPGACARLVERAVDRGHRHHPRRSEASSATEAIERAPVASQEGSLVVVSDGFGRVVDGQVVHYEPRVAKDASELRRLVGLRDAAANVLAVQTCHGADGELEAAQAELHRCYDTYRRMHGPLNRFKLARTGRVDPDTGEERTRRMRPRMGGFRHDPGWPLVSALEIFDDDLQRATKAPIFDTRVIDPPVPRLGVDDPSEAVAVCLDERGCIDLQRVAELLGTSTEEAAAGLSDLTWENPATGQLEPAARYLSGNIRQKLDEARRATTRDPRFHEQVAALERVLPPQLEPEEIAVRLGVPWIPPSDVEAFCGDVLGARIEIEYLASLGRWEVAAPAGRRGVAFSAEWGTPRADAVTLLRASLNQQLHTVYDETDDGRRVRNDPETIAAREKQDALGQRFASWIWDDSSRADRLSDRYNELFRSTVVPVHDGSHLSLPGLAASFTPHQHQRDSVARILTDGRALLAHAVGAGKTATMAMAAMEMRRLGLASKPALVVPNHMLEQFAREWLQLYPKAKLLIADREKLAKKHRTEFVARATTGDWDAIIFSQSTFVRLPLGPEQQVEYVGERLRQLRDAVSQSRDGRSLSVKRLERYVAAEEERLRSLQAAHRKDDGVHFEETGIDHLLVDEAHFFKNRRVASSIEGMAHRGSQRAEDLDAKLWVLRKRYGPRVVTFATATPVANSMAELWVMQSYLQPDVLEEVGLGPFDAWAANFGRTVTSLELSPDGTSWRLSTRFARFCNVPELMGLWRQVADVRTANDLDLPVPSIIGHSPQTVVVPGSGALADYVADLAERAERVRSRSVDPTEDNMLKITGDGRRAALDLRLVGEPPDHGGKLAVAADRIAETWQETRTATFGDSCERGGDRQGALQLVFCDTSTPTGNGWNAYDELRALLVGRGVPRDRVRFVHEATSDDAKAKLFAACRDGRVAVLVGSTEKMGVGTNVQDRAIALHHLDCPWRPADIEQREGRIIRQGNLNREVAIVRYVTEGSFDTYMWQTLERKAAFIGQVTGGDLDGREVDDIADTALTYAEVKALATGNPLIMEKAGIDADVARLTRLERSHADEQHRLRRAVESAQRQEASLRHKATRIDKALAVRVDTRADRFRMTVRDRTISKRVDAGEELAELGRRLLDKTPLSQSRKEMVGELGGLSIEIEATRVITPEIFVRIGAGIAEVRWQADEWTNADPARLVTALERPLHRLDDDLVAVTTGIEQATAEVTRARSRIGQPFEHDDDLRFARKRQLEIAELLTPEPVAPEPPSPPVQPPPLAR